MLMLWQNFLDRNELPSKNIGLIDFIGKTNEAIIYGKLDHSRDVRITETRAGRIPGINDHNYPHINVPLNRFKVWFRNGANIRFPLIFLVEKV